MKRYKRTGGEGRLDNGVGIEGSAADEGLAGVLGLARRAVRDGAAQTVAQHNARTRVK